MKNSIVFSNRQVEDLAIALDAVPGARVGALGLQPPSIFDTLEGVNADRWQKLIKMVDFLTYPPRIPGEVIEHSEKLRRNTSITSDASRDIIAKTNTCRIVESCTNNSPRFLSSRQLKNFAFAVDAACCARIVALGVETSTVDDVLEVLTLHGSRNILQVFNHILSMAEKIYAEKSKVAGAAREHLGTTADMEEGK
jgi:hypothetical protein